MTTRINANSGLNTAQFAALDEEAQIAVTIHQNAQKDRAEGRKDRQAARRDEIRSMRAKAVELRKAAQQKRVLGVVSIVGGTAAAIGAATPGLKALGWVSKSNAAIISALSGTVQGLSKVAEGAAQLDYNDGDTRATLATISASEKLADNRAQNASEDIQDAKKSADTAKDLMQKLADARFRAMQTATRG